MANIGSLTSTLELNSSQFNRNLSRAQRNVRSFSTRTNQHLAKMERQWKSFSRQVGNMRKRFLNLNAAIGSLAGSAGLGLLVKRSLDATAQLEKNAKMAGVSTKAYQELRHAAREYHITQEALSDGLKELSLRSEEYVKTGAGPAKEALERLGYSQDELNKKLQNTPALLRDMISRMEDLDRAAQIRIADEIFGGQGGEQFVAMIQGGAKALDGLRQEAHDLGVVMDKDMIRKSNEARRQIEKLVNVLSAQFNVAIAELAPDIARTSQNMMEWVGHNKDFLTQDIPNHINNMASAVSDFVNSKEFKMISEYWELMAGAAIGAKVGGPLGALLGAGAGGYYSAYKDLKELGGSSEEAQGKLEELNAELKEHQKIASDLLEAGPENWGPLQAEQFAESSKKAAFLSAEMEEVAERQKQANKATEESSIEFNKLEKSYQETTKAASDFVPISEEIANKLHEQEEAVRSTLDAYADKRAELLMTQRQHEKYQAVMEAGVGWQSEEAKEIRASIDAYHDLQLIIEGTESATEAMQKGSSESLDKVERDNKQAASAMEHAWEEAYRSMESGFGDIFYDSMTGQLDDLEDYFKRIVDSMIRTWADAQGEMMAKNVMNKSGLGATMSEQAQERAGLSGERGWMQELWGGSSGYGNQYTGTASATSSPNMALQGVQRVTPQQQASTGAQNALQGVSGSGGGMFSGGNMMSYGQGAMTAYSLYKDRKETSPATGAITGAGQGAMVGGQVGGGYGAIIGAIAGGLYGGLVSGQDPDDTDLYYGFGPMREEQHEDISRRRYWGGKSRDSYRDGQEIPNELASAGDIELRRDDLIGVNVRKGDAWSDEEAKEVEKVLANYWDQAFDNMNQVLDGTVTDVVQDTVTRHKNDYQKWFGEDKDGIKKSIESMGETFFDAYGEALYESAIGHTSVLFDADFVEGIKQEGEALHQAFVRSAEVLDAIPYSITKLKEKMEEGLSKAEAFRELEQEYQQVQEILGPAIEQGLDQSIESLDPTDFREGLTKHLEQQMQEAVVQAAQQQMQQSIIEGAFDETLGLTDIMQEYFSGGMGIGELSGKFDQAMNKIRDSIDSDVYKQFADVIRELGLQIEDTTEQSKKSVDHYEEQVTDAREKYISALEREYNSLQEEQEQLEQNLSDAKSTYVSILEDEQSELESTADAMEQLTKSLSDYHSEILLSEESTLGAGERARFARSEFTDTAELARRGDQEAMEALQSVSSDYLSAARDAGMGGDAFREVQKALNATESVAESELSEVEKQLESLDKQLESLQGTEDSVSSIERAQRDYQDAKEELDRWNKNHDLTWYEEELARLDNINNSTLGVRDALDNYQSALNSAISSGYEDLESKFQKELEKQEEQERSSGGKTNAVSRAYRDILGRDPDPAGAEWYKDKLDEGMSVSRMREKIRWDKDERGAMQHGGTISGPMSGYSLPGVEFHGVEHITPDSQMKDVKEQLKEIKQVLSMMLNTNGDQKKYAKKMWQILDGSARGDQPLQTEST